MVLKTGTDDLFRIRFIHVGAVGSRVSKSRPGRMGLTFVRDNLVTSETVDRPVEVFVSGARFQVQPR